MKTVICKSPSSPPSTSSPRRSTVLRFSYSAVYGILWYVLSCLFFFRLLSSFVLYFVLSIMLFFYAVQFSFFQSSGKKYPDKELCESFSVFWSQMGTGERCLRGFEGLICTFVDATSWKSVRSEVHVCWCLFFAKFP